MQVRVVGQSPPLDSRPTLGSMAEEQTGVEIHTRVELKKFDGDVPPEHQDDPEAHGHRLLETIVMEDGKPTERIVHAAD
jgi:hypothetical protein